jgi:hypothetical protein
VGIVLGVLVNASNLYLGKLAHCPGTPEVHSADSS